MDRTTFTARMVAEFAKVGRPADDVRVRKYRDGFRCHLLQPAGKPNMTLEWTPRTATHIIVYAEFPNPRSFGTTDKPVARIPV